MPTDRLLVETDQPVSYARPASRAKKLSQKRRACRKAFGGIKGISAERMENATAENAKRVFGIE